MSLRPEQREGLKAQVALYQEKYLTFPCGENIAHINAHARYIEERLTYLENLRHQIDESEYVDEYEEACFSLFNLKSEEVVSEELPAAASEYLKDKLTEHQVAVKRDRMHEELLEVGAPFLIPTFRTQNPFDTVTEIVRLGPSKAAFERIAKERATIDAGGAGFELKQVIAAFTIQRIKELGLTEETIDLIERYHTEIIKVGMGEDLQRVITPLEEKLATQIDERVRKITKMAVKIERAAVYDRAKELLRPVGEAFATAKLLKMHDAELNFIEMRIRILKEELSPELLDGLKEVALKQGIDPVQVGSIARCRDIEELVLKAELIERQVNEIERGTGVRLALFDEGKASLTTLSQYTHMLGAQMLNHAPTVGAAIGAMACIIFAMTSTAGLGLTLTAPYAGLAIGYLAPITFQAVKSGFCFYEIEKKFDNFIEKFLFENNLKISIKESSNFTGFKFKVRLTIPSEFQKELNSLLLIANRQKDNTFRITIKYTFKDGIDPQNHTEKLETSIITPISQAWEKADLKELQQDIEKAFSI